jgi:curved DNA-binding protein CbpA
VLGSDKFMNYYEVLEVSPKASQAVIRAAYKTLMQRYHPDKNMGYPEMAQQAVLIGQAFEVLSDQEKREAYDMDLARQSILKEKQSRAFAVAVTAQQRKQPTEPRIYRPASPNDPPGVTPAYWLLGFLVVGGLYLYLPSNTSTQEHQAASKQATESAREQQAKQEAERAASAEAKKLKEAELKLARTIPQFAKVITVKMPPTVNGFRFCSIENCPHYVTIPTLGLVVHKVDSEKIMQHIERNKTLIMEEIKRDLGSHLYTELMQVDGEETLKRILLKRLNLTIVGYKSELKGVEEVLLPESFSVH